MSRSRGPGVPITLKCSTCKKSRNFYDDTKTGVLWRTGKTCLRLTNNLMPRMTRTKHQLWCSVCGRYMWSAHVDAERKPLVTTEDV